MIPADFDYQAADASRTPSGSSRRAARTPSCSPAATRCCR